jgi:peptidoglycan/LPS O-acetylase OafA/YrhL
MLLKSDIVRSSPLLGGKNLEKRNKELDGLRGLAALAVALGHCNLGVTGIDVLRKSIVDFPQMSVRDIIGRLGHIVFPAEAAVIIFFVMSGYVLWGSLCRTVTSPAVSFLPYLIRRAYRLLPASIMSAIILGFMIDASAKDVSQNALLLSYSMNGVLWSLQVEVVGSIFIFLTYSVAMRISWFLVPLMMISVVLAYAYPHPLIRYLPTFMLGISIHYVAPRLFSSRLLIIVAYFIMVSADFFLKEAKLAKAFVFITAWIVVVAVAHNRPKFFARRIVNFLGDISYSFYLSHAVGVIIANYLFLKIGLDFKMMNGFIMFLSLSVMSLTVTIPLSWLLHILIEKPGMLAGSSVAKDLGNWIQKYIKSPQG